MDFNTAHTQAQGRWRDILGKIGVSQKYLTGKHCPCPICGGKDRFRFDDKHGRGGWICSSCGAGDGFALVARLRKVDMIKAKMMVAPLIGGAVKETVKKQESHVSLRVAAERFWKATTTISEGSPVGQYLKQRLGVYEPVKVLRQGQANHPADKATTYNVMAAKISAPDGSGVSVHKTYVTSNGSKANLDPAKVMMAGPLVPGASIWLSDPAEHMGIAEGIETALSAAILHKVPTWAAISASMMKSFEPPVICKKLTIYSDNDPNFVGQSAAYELARKLVATRQIDVEVMVPDQIGDWNDVLSKRRNKNTAR